jgi:hypothetical protein
MPAEAVLPTGYRSLTCVRLPRRWLSLAGAVAFVPLTLAFAALAAYWIEVPLVRVWQAVPVLGCSDHEVFYLGDGVILLGVLPLLIAHELVHGLVARLLGATPYFGVRWFSAYTGIEQGYFTRRQYAAFIAAPLVVFTALGLAAIFLEVRWVGAVVFYLGLHTAGCTGDLWMLAQVVRLPPGVRIADRPYGCEAFGEMRNEK